MMRLRERQISSMRFYYARPLWMKGEKKRKRKEKNEMKKNDMGAARGIIAFLTKE